MNVTPIRESVPRVTKFDERGVPCEAEIPSRSRPHITYKMRRTGGRWIHQVGPCEAAQFGVECNHLRDLERITKEDYMTTDTVEGEVISSREVQLHGGSAIITADVDGALAAWQGYQRLTRELLDAKTDYQDVGGGKQFKKKSAWRKYANAFKISDHVTFEEIHRDERGRPIWARVRVEAYHEGTGRRAEAGHECHRLERCCPAAEGDKCFKRHTCCLLDCDGLQHWAHPGDVTETALTRAKNRAISDLIGAGEVSAEEMTEEMTFAQGTQGSGLQASAPPQDRSARTPPPPWPTPHPPAGTVAPECPAGHGVAAFVKAGVSKAGREYGAFWGCRDKSCVAGYKGKAWSINADAWEDEISVKGVLDSGSAPSHDFDADLPYE